jgi:Ca-activated chloride channel family protein
MAKSARVFLLLLVPAGLDAVAAARPARADDEEVAEARSLSPYFLLPHGDPSIDQFPLLSTAADVRVSGVIADVRVKQTYKNAGQRALEAVYVFPASSRTAVYGMKMTIGERTIVAKIQERERARQDYEQAKRQGQSASLLEQQRPNVFQMNVANLMPGDVITVELFYTELLVPVAATYELVFPTVVGPRYVRGPETAADDDQDPAEGFTANPTLPAGVPPSYDLDLNVQLDAGMPLFDLASPSHRVQIAGDGPTRAKVKLDPSERQGGNRDFILRYRLAGDRIASGLVLAKRQAGGSFLLMVQPPREVKPADLPPREYIFILDVSGSMHGFPLETAKRLLGDLVSGLRPKDSFNIVLFESTSRSLAPRSVPATRHNLKVARCFIDSQSGGGGTELLPALAHALALPRVAGASRTVILATDGFVNVEAEAMRVAQKNLGNANLFAFGIGKSVNRFLLEALARVGRGEPAIVTDEDEAAERAEQFRRYVEAPVLTGIKVSFEGFQAAAVEPESIPDVFASRPVMVFGKWIGEPRGRIVVHGTTGEHPFEQGFDVAGIKVSDDDRGLRNLWARSRIESLSDLEALHDPNHRQEIADLGLQNSLLTRYTSFVAIDSEVRNAQGDSITVRQPLPMPEGVSNLAVGGYAPAPAAAAGALPAPGYAQPMGFRQEAAESLARVQTEALYERHGHRMPSGWPHLLLGSDELELGGGAAINVTPDQAGEPLRIPLALAYGATRRLALGLHSREGLCVTGSKHGCAHVFNQLGADLLYALVPDDDGGMALRLGFSFASVDPAWARLALGVPMQLALSRNLLLLRFEPGFEWGLNDTDDNPAVLVLPLRLHLLASDDVSLYALGGFQATWSQTGKRYVLPAGIGLQIAAATWLDIALELTLVAKAGSELPEAARRIFYDSTATLTPAVYDRNLLISFRLHGPAGAIGRIAVSRYQGDWRDYRPRRAPAPPVCDEVEW